MNGAVYISFFQGQLESVLEQVVQLAVQEISKTVGSSLNSMLLETAAKEQENQRLGLKLRSSREGGEGGGRAAENGSSAPGKAPGKAPGNKAAAGCKGAHDGAGSARTKPEQHTHPPGHGAHNDTRRLEQKGRVVGQLKTVMEQVLDFAVCELTKIVEASFDDLLLEITKKEREQQALEERLGRSTERGGENGRGGKGRRRGSENDSESPSGSEDAREEQGDVSKETGQTANDDSCKPAVLSISQDWVPTLDKVFGQKWCSDLWHIKELVPSSSSGGGKGRGGEGLLDSTSNPALRAEDLEPSPTSPQQDPRWTPLEDMEVLSPEHDEEEERKRRAGGGRSGAGPSPGPALSPAGFLNNPGNGGAGTSGTSPEPMSPTEGSGRCSSSASMLHRLLTLPAQLLEDDEENTDAMETLAALATDTMPANGRRHDTESPGQTCPSPLMAREEDEEDEEEEGEEEEEKGRKKKRRRVWLECEECGRRFSRASLLKAHRQTHADDAVITEMASSPADGTAPAAMLSGLRCSECGKRFSSATRLQGHLRTYHPGKRS